MSKSYPLNKGGFFVIEGTDGSGKGTQVEILINKLKSEGYDAELFDFPQYDKESSYFIKQYLNGEYGTADEINPYTGSLFFAMDRFEAAKKIQQALDEGKIVIANRFTGSNMAHQGTKFSNPEERRGYFIWLDNLEFEMLKIPRPDKSIVLRVPADIAQQLVDKKGARNYTDKKRDIHEADLNHLTKSVEVYDDICKLFPKDFERIDCVRSGKLMTIDEISDFIWETLRPYLPERTKADSVARLNVTKSKNIKEKVMEKEPNPYLINSGNEFKITEEGQKFLEESVTNTTSNVYGFTNRLSTLTIAAAMARLSRRGDDMRITILDEFAPHEGKDDALLKRVITAYGDDSVQQLVGQHLVVEEASNLLTKQLEWGRLASYLEQSTRYIYFDKKDKEGKYKYFTPETFDLETQNMYESQMDIIFDKYSHMVHELTDYIEKTDTTPKNERDIAWKQSVRAKACDAIRPVLPVSTKSTVGIFASGQALEQLIMRLRASESFEARETGTKILEESRKIIPTFLERADDPQRGGATTAYLAETKLNIKNLAKDYLPEIYSTDLESVNLRSVWPKNELDLVPYMLFEHTELSLDEIQSEVDNWPVEKKIEIFETYMGERMNRRHKPGRAIELARYTFDLVCDYGIFRDLQRHRMVDDLEWQKLTPRYGFDTPEIVDEAGLSEEFEDCFELSAELYSKLQSNGYHYEAQYATLLGHKMRWTITYNAREAFHLHELRTSPQGHSGYRKLVNEMHEQVSEHHPMLAEAMIFVNKGEDENLNRLAAERATQYKLNKLDNI